MPRRDACRRCRFSPPVFIRLFAAGRVRLRHAAIRFRHDSSHFAFHFHSPAVSFSLITLAFHIFIFRLLLSVDCHFSAIFSFRQLSFFQHDFAHAISHISHCIIDFYFIFAYFLSLIFTFISLRL